MKRVLLHLCLLLAALGALTLVVLILVQIPSWRATGRSDRLIKQAQALAGKGDRAEARTKIEEALQLAPDNPTARRELGLYYLAEHKVLEGLTELRAVAQARPYDPGAAWEFAFALIAAKQPQEAEHWFQRVTRMERGNGAAYAMLATCQLQRGAAQQALRTAELAAKISPRISMTHATLGLVRWRAGELDSARAAFDEVLRLRPSDIKVMLSLAAITGQMRRFDLALGYLQRAVAILPDDPNLWIALGTALYETKQHAEAAQAFSCALTLDPTNAMAREGLTRSRDQ